MLAGHGGGPAQRVVARLFDGAVDPALGPARDDIAILAARVDG